MQDSTQQKAIITIIGIIIVLLFLGILFVVMLVYYSNKKKQIERERVAMQQSFAQQLLQSQLEVAEQTRHRIAEELHDNIGALASLIKMNIGLMESATQVTKKDEILAESKDLIKSLIADVKQLSISLDTNRLSNISIAKAIAQEVKRLQKLDRFTTNFTIQGDETSLPDDKHIIVFRICQELLHNIVKHANPTNVGVILNFTQTQLIISVFDDGIGFNIEAAKQQINGSGLINLYNRAKLVGGSLYLKSDAQLGTHCTVQVPTTA